MISEEAKRRARILTFWQKHGAEAVEEAYGVKLRTLFNWQRKLKGGRGKLESLNPGSRAPRVVRKRLWDAAIVEEIKRLRFDHPNLSKEKLHPLLMEFCAAKKLPCPKERTVGRLIADLGGLRRTAACHGNRQSTARHTPEKRAKASWIQGTLSRPLRRPRYVRGTHQRIEEVRHHLH